MLNAAVGFRGRCQDKCVAVELFCLEKYYLLLVTCILFWLQNYDPINIFVQSCQDRATNLWVFKSSKIYSILFYIQGTLCVLLMDKIV